MFTRHRWCLPLIAVVSAFENVAVAGTITFGGLITQPQDVTMPAVNNPSLNNVKDLQAYTVTLGFPGSITAPGTYNLSSLTFRVPTAPAIESGFSSISLTITASGGFDQGGNARPRVSLPDVDG